MIEDAAGVSRRRGQVRMIVRRLPWLILVFVGCSIVAVVALGSSMDAAAFAAVAFILGYGAVGALLASRLPQHPIGWLLLAASALFSMGGLLVTYGERARSPSPLTVIGGDWSFGVGVTIASTFVLLLFPTGRLPSPRWKGVGWIAASGSLMLLVGVALSPDSFEGLAMVNPYALPRDDLRLILLETGGLALLAMGILASLGSLVVRMMRGDHTERRQLMWVVLAVIVLASGVLGILGWEMANGSADLSDDLENVVISLCLSLVPVAIGVAILRYRLFEIDRILSRTVSYGLVIGFLGLVFFGMTSGLTAFLPSDDPLVVATSTLAVFGLFNPVRSKIQAVVDRRFGRSRYDAERVTDDFAGSLQERVDPDGVVEGWVGVVEATMQPVSVGVWVKD